MLLLLLLLLLLRVLQGMGANTICELFLLGLGQVNFGLLLLILMNIGLRIDWLISWWLILRSTVMIRVDLVS
jgi:hypothetical protein